MCIKLIDRWLLNNLIDKRHVVDGDAYDVELTDYH
jgi:hypothetical protein